MYRFDDCFNHQWPEYQRSRDQMPLALLGRWWSWPFGDLEDLGDLETGSKKAVNVCGHLIEPCTPKALDAWLNVDYIFGIDWRNLVATEFVVFKIQKGIKRVVTCALLTFPRRLWKNFKRPYHCFNLVNKYAGKADLDLDWRHIFNTLYNSLQ